MLASTKNPQTFLCISVGIVYTEFSWRFNFTLSYFLSICLGKDGESVPFLVLESKMRDLLVRRHVGGRVIGVFAYHANNRWQM